MNAEALIGTVLGTCTLQKLIGQGGMGAVFLAQQSRPRRQVAVKVLLPMTPLNHHQLVAFLERFRRETDAAASLEHPNIMPVHEYGERDGVAYLVMPYISGGTLRDEMEREGPLPLEKVVYYLEQIAAAIDLAHEHGVIHRDIKPANILLTPEGRLLLTDFGLVKIIAEGRAPQMRLTGDGAPVGTPDYMAPEQVIGDDVGPRADLYSLGVILYQMVTGTTPFQGETPMQIAAQHLQIPPPSPQMLRSDLPIMSEQVILRALAKRPLDRYDCALDLANAFRASLLGTGIMLPMNTSSMPSIKAMGATGQFLAPKGQGMIEPTRQDQGWQESAWPMPATPNGGNRGGGLLSRTGLMPTLANATGTLPPSGGGLLSRTGKFPQVGMGLGTGQFGAATASGFINAPSTPTENVQPPFGAQPALLPHFTGQSAAVGKTSTGSLPVPGQQVGPGTMKLTGPVKVVKVPVAGQPGHYVTGILPFAAQEEEKIGEQRRKLSPVTKIVSGVLVAAVLAVLVFGALSLRSHSNNQGTHQPTAQGTPDPKATAAAQIIATAQANILVNDPLTRNSNNWPVTDGYAFKDGAYHITVQTDKGGGALLPSNQPFNTPMVYSLTMQEIIGNDDTGNNSFGMIFRYNKTPQATTFYSFEVVNTKGGGYQLWKYDTSKGVGKEWTSLLPNAAPFGDEFHQGHGPQAINTFRIAMNGGTFTFTVNGKKLPTTVTDNSYPSGTVGMIVNLKGTEVAFKDLLITRQ